MDIKTGDTILCSGNSSLSKQIRMTQDLFCKAQNRPELIQSGATKITHVAGVIMDDLLFESTTLNKYNGKKGVQVNKFSEWIKHYNGIVYIRRCRDIEYPMRLSREAIILTGTPYENGIPGAMELLLSGLSGFKNLPETTYLHCSEGWAKAYIGASIMPSFPPHKLPPMEWFDVHGKIEKLMPKFFAEAERIR